MDSARIGACCGSGRSGFALLGTLVGIFTIVIGVGPRSVLDIVYHVAIVAVLVWALIVASRTRIVA